MLSNHNSSFVMEESFVFYGSSYRVGARYISRKHFLLHKNNGALPIVRPSGESITRTRATRGSSFH